MPSSRFPVLRGPDIQQSRVQDNVQAVLGPVAQALQSTPIMGAAPPSWIAPSPLNGWANIGGIRSPLGFHKDALGYVHLRGYMLAGTLNAAAFNLPLGYRPAYRTVLNGCAFNGGIVTAQIEVRQDGQVFFNCIAATTEVVIDGLTFLAEA